MGRRMDPRILKMRKRFRFAKFSGATTKTLARIDHGRWQDVTKVGQEPNEDYVPSGKHVEVLVGPVSFSKQVINTGRGPDKLRLQEYYARLNSFEEVVPKTLGVSGPMFELALQYERIVKEIPKESRVVLYEDSLGKIVLHGKPSERTWFFVEVDNLKKRIRRSKSYASKSFAMQMFHLEDGITWVEVTP